MNCSFGTLIITENQAGYSTWTIIGVLERLAVTCEFVFQYLGSEKSDIPLT